jgi:hypothetical protein
MVLNDAFAGEVDDVLLGNAARWLERVPPEVEWDEGELALVVHDLVGWSRMRSYMSHSPGASELPR